MCNIPFYWGGIVFEACVDDVQGTRRASMARFLDIFATMTTCSDDAARFMVVASHASQDGFERANIIPLVTFVTERHPGLLVSVCPLVY